MSNKFRLLYLGNVLSKHGFTPTTIETLGDRFQKDITLFRYSTKRNKVFRLIDMCLAVIRHRKEIDVVLIDTYSSSAFLFAVVCSKVANIFGMPYLAFLHGGDLPKRFKSNKSISKKYLKEAEQIISPSGFLDHAVRQNFSLETAIIPNFIDIENYPFHLRQSLDEVRILWVRSFHEMYQPEIAVRIVKLISVSNILCSLTMVGPDKDGSLKKCQDLAEELGIKKNIQFTGRLTKEEWVNMSSEYNLFLSTTSVDNTPVSVMEAMALGLPVVSTKVGGIPFLFQDGKEGIMVEDQTPASFTEAILQLRHRKEQFANISKAAREKSKEWDWPVVREQWLQLFRTI